MKFYEIIYPLFVIFFILFVVGSISMILYYGVKSGADKQMFEEGTELCGKLQLNLVDSKIPFSNGYKYLCSDNRWYTTEHYCKTEYKGTCVEVDKRIILVGD